MSVICEGPSQVLKQMKGTCKLPSKWTSSFCAQFIVKVVEIVEEGQHLYQDSSLCKHRRRTNKSSHPQAFGKLVSMV